MLMGIRKFIYTVSAALPAGIGVIPTEARNTCLRLMPFLFTVLSALLAVVLLSGVYRSRESLAEKCGRASNYRRAFALLVLAGLVLRAFLASCWHGHDSDMLCWIGWGSQIADDGPAVFYTAPGHEWYDYPPGYMLLLGGLTRVLRFLRIDAYSNAGIFAYMLPAYAADVGIAVLLMRAALREKLGEGWALLLGALVIFDPAAVVLSGAWGQIDSILTLLLLLSFIALMKNRRIPAGIFYALAVMCKWQALIYGPVLAAAYIFSVRSRKDLLMTVGAVASAFAVILLISLPFRGEQRALWLVDRFLSAGSGYDYASVEAYNFQALLGGNWAKSSNRIFSFLSYKTFGTAAVLIAVLASVFTQYKTLRQELRHSGSSELSRRGSFLAAAFCMYTIYTFGHYMHERYVFPVIFLLLFVFLLTKDARFMFCSLLLSCVVFLNECTAMYVVSELASSAVRGGREHNAVVLICSVAETLSYFVFLFVFADTRRPAKKQKD